MEQQASNIKRWRRLTDRDHAVFKPFAPATYFDLNDSAELEQEAFDSHQSKVIREHEHSFMLEEETFSALVEETVLVPGRQTASRVLAFGADPARVPKEAVSATLLRLDAREPHTGADSVLSVWAASEPDGFAAPSPESGRSSACPARRRPSGSA